MIPLELSHTQNNFEIVIFHISVQSVLTRLTLIKFMDTETRRRMQSWNYKEAKLFTMTCSFHVVIVASGGWTVWRDLVPSYGIMAR